MDELTLDEVKSVEELRGESKSNALRQNPKSGMSGISGIPSFPRKLKSVTFINRPFFFSSADCIINGMDKIRGFGGYITKGEE
ncbi:hypothetical protein HYU14_04440 [Candidatus Woesearchaeota archaeon]|nr:hypothetical protein [Candidatus Woesearchaeota archaeon]